MATRLRSWPKVQSLMAIVGLLLLGTPAWGEVGPCAKCHDEAVPDSSVHRGTECIDCHSNVVDRKHKRDALDELSGNAMCIQCHEFGVAFRSGVHGGEGCDTCHEGGHDIAAPDSGMCTDCHRRAVRALRGSVHEDEASCGDCHGRAHRIASADDVLCHDCHRRALRALKRSVHAERASCVDCHGKGHKILEHHDLDSAASAYNQIRSCGQCHDSPPELIDGYLTSEHGRALLVSGLEAAPSCADCHGSHDVKDCEEEGATASRKRVPETCGSCHMLILRDWTEQSAHGQAWKEEREDGPVCTTCHASHEIGDPLSKTVRLGYPEGCGDCHGELYSTFRGSFHGKATDLGFKAGAICSDCHTPHKNLPASDPRSSIHPDHLGETCGACHENITTSFLSFDPHNNPSDRDDNEAVFFVWLFMTGLLLGVFGFFFIHDLLWLQRSLVARIRGEFGPKPPLDGPWVRRFDRVHIWMHVVVVITFLLLAATGLPLKFHAEEWARFAIALLGGVDSARLIHRVAAIATFGYFIVHIGQIAFRATMSKEKGMFWGFKSLVPQPRDIAELFRYFRYFLYVGKRPAGDRWTYWEKFDYMAVFWGVPIIGISGLVLWYPTFFSQVLPGWALNAAYVIHSDEALLATGFIFVFHFFHTHMRPESFPMDTVVFTGRMPLERFKEERPLEYRRLMDNGELEKHLVDPPSPLEMRKAYIFGTIALATGLSLAVGIFWALFHELQAIFH